MDLAVDPGLRETLDAVRSFVDRAVIPFERRFLAEGFRAVRPELDQLREDVREHGWWTPHLPADLGGMGLSLLEFARLAEVLGRSILAHYVFNCQAPDAGNMEILRDHATPDQRARWLEPLCRGEIRSCFTMTEPDRPGSNPTWMETRAVREGDEWVIDGRKWFATGADGAALAVCMAVTDPDATDRHRRASMFLVPTDAAGYRLVRNTRVMGETGEGWLSHGEVTYDGCRVSAANLLGERGAGFAIAQERLGPGRIHHCMRWLGICERAFDLMVGRARSRDVAPDRSLGSRQTVRTWIAESRAEIEAARLLVLRTAARIIDAGQQAVRDDVSLIKFHVAGVLQRVLDRALQVHGGLGMTDRTPIAFWYRHERAARIYDGPDEVHKMAVARRILRRAEREEDADG